MNEGKNVFKIVTGKDTGKRHLGGCRHRLEDNIRIDSKEIGISTRNWVDSAQDRDYCRALVKSALNLRVALAMELINREENRYIFKGQYYECIIFKTGVY